MPRYFMAVAYRGTRFSGFQVQENAKTVQSEIEHAFSLLHRVKVGFTGSSRTDAGVHALENFFHFDFEPAVHPQLVYKMNAILPPDLVVKAIYPMPPEAHSRFDASSREYQYRLHSFKNPFLEGVSYFYPYRLDLDLMQEAAAMVTGKSNFFAFAKTNTQVKNFECRMIKSRWLSEGDQLVYEVQGNRFLRGMVRLLTASLLRVGRGKLSVSDFAGLFEGKEKAGLSVPSHGLFLRRVHYPENFFPASGEAFRGF